ncbi:phage terminase small subunit P27 family [Wenxinia marina]|uniref:Phage terminase, small subunit, putative, P27 family n=1 Tax=Wenxinia marina DSM 24838 TaxID=1123501 RepID=A0A0D0Q4H7_9RHOB|nr:phage terminase small subunit P27 family [Wenxinia marina]KIQ69444.1 phage terminase, small subunit, putative, P27 family [Wenxinia marina DSM 24838]GGL58414.1 hypothetical protein GCM10011392_11070 [Wenxinia marina]
MTARGRRPKPTAIRRLEGNPGKRGYNQDEPVPPEGCPGCPPHLNEPARDEWHRLAPHLHEMGVLTLVDRAALAAYCQAYGRWVEAEERLAALPAMVKTPSGYVQQNPWIGVANKQLELMGRFAVEMGMTPASRSRVVANPPPGSKYLIDTGVPRVEYSIVSRDETGKFVEQPFEPVGDKSGVAAKGEE